MRVSGFLDLAVRPRTPEAENSSFADGAELQEGLAVILSDILGIGVAAEDVELTVLNDTQTGRRLSERRLQEAVELVRATFVAYKAFVLEQDAAGFLDNVTTLLQSTATLNQVTTNLAEQLELANASFQVDEIFVVSMDVAQASDPPIEIAIRPNTLEEADNNIAVASVVAVAAVVAGCCIFMLLYLRYARGRKAQGEGKEDLAKNILAGVSVDTQAEPIDNIMAASNSGGANVTDILNNVQGLEEVLQEVGISFYESIDNAAETQRMDADIDLVDEELEVAMKNIGVSFDDGLQPSALEGVVEVHEDHLSL